MYEIKSAQIKHSSFISLHTELQWAYYVHIREITHSFSLLLIAVVCSKRHLHNHLIPYMQSVNTDLARKRERQLGFKHGEILTCDQEWDQCVSFTPLKRRPAKAVKQHQSTELHFPLPASNVWCPSLLSTFCLWYICRVWLGLFSTAHWCFQGCRNYLKTGRETYMLLAWLMHFRWLKDLLKVHILEVGTSYKD